MKIYPRGSEWRKWDLHVHVPGTKLNNGYGVSPDWDLFCRILEESDVVAFGITDYFSADAFYEFATRYKELYPNSEKVFFPNIELRLNETVNGDNQDVNLHLIFRPDVPKEKLELLLRELKTEITDGNNRNIPCSELATEAQYRAATVTRTNLRNAFENTFGKESAWSDNVIVVVPANNDGIRPPSGAARKANLADQIDKGADALFGHSGNTDHFLKTDRFEDASQLAIPKPVFAGCDAHSFDELEQWLGKQVEDAENRKQVTWIKADLTFEGLQQTLVEPAQRVRIQAVKPDARQPYQYIAKVRFSGTGEFPEEVLLNQNLVSVIGTRSSGKSALLAYIAHAVDPHYAVAQQVATRLVDKDEAGPAAGKTWDSVSNINCSVEWGDPAVETGKVIYIPQNSLYAISERPEEITAKIQPALYRLDSKFAANHRQAQADVEACNTGIRTAVARWFSLAEEITNANRTLRDLGDKKGVVSTRNSLAEKIAALRESASLSETEMATYQELVTKIAEQDSRVKKIVEETELLSPYLSRSEDGSYAVVGTVGVNIDTVPAPTTFPEGLQQKLLTAVEEAKRPLLVRVGQEISAYQAALDSEAAELRKSSRSMREDNVSLIEKYKAHAELDSLVQNLRKQEEVLAAIDAQGKVIAQLVEKQSAQVELVKSELTKRQNHLSGLVAAFSSAKTTLDDGMSFGIETDFTLEEVQSLSRRFNVQNIGLYVDRDKQRVEIDKAQGDPLSFLAAMYSGAQKIRRGEKAEVVSADVLAATPEVRFYATLDGDRIGGFRRSSMTPGKQALFALTLILNESAEAWPLLIDQPEDDLDSRSVYEHIVPYLIKRKAERQILMVSHNANLVVGADSEQIVVANRHGEDRQNEGAQAFAYFSGSLEHSERTKKSKYVLKSCGIREHACEILDGGAEAFQKRKSKYKI